MEVWGIGLGIIGAFGVIPVFVAGITKLGELLTNSHLSYVWRMNSLGWAIIKPRYDQRMARIEDVIATQKIRDFFQRKKIRFIDRDDRDPAPDGLNLICICGPKANKVSSELAPQFPLSWEICVDSAGTPFLLDHKTKANIYAPNGQPVHFALLAKVSEKTGNRNFIFCWGLGGTATIGAAQMLFDPVLLTAIRKRKPKQDFAAIVAVPFTSFDTIGTPMLYALRKGPDVYRSVP